MIEPQRFTSKFFHRSNLRRHNCPPPQSLPDGRKGDDYHLVTHTASSDNWRLATGNCFSESFPGSAHWVRPLKTRQRRVLAYTDTAPRPQEQVHRSHLYVPSLKGLSSLTTITQRSRAGYNCFALRAEDRKKDPQDSYPSKRSLGGAPGLP